MDSFKDMPDDDHLWEMIASDMGLEFSTVIPKPDDVYLSSFSRSQARRYKAMPVSRRPDGVRVFTSDPLDFECLDSMRQIIGENIVPIVTRDDILKSAVDEYLDD
ncbi:MAG: hypothetical protein AAFY98_03305 [Verrucomicrobiota bacterium]